MLVPGWGREGPDFFLVDLRGFHSLADVAWNKTIVLGLLKRLMERHVDIVNGTWSQPRIQLLTV
jgi:hypothetical protein